MRKIVSSPVFRALIAVLPFGTSLTLGCGATPTEAASAPLSGEDPVGPDESNGPEAPTTKAPTAEAPTTEAPAVEAPRGKVAACTFGQDQTCNADPAVSSIWGKCEATGKCTCKEGFVLTFPGERCAPPPTDSK